MKQEDIILNPFLRSYQVDKVLALVVAYPVAKKWYPLARKSGFRGSLEDFQEFPECLQNVSGSQRICIYCFDLKWQV